MDRGAQRVAALLAAVAVAAWGCADSSSGRGDATDDGGRSEVDLDASPDGGEGDAGPPLGFRTGVMNRAEVLADRICDLDGDGDLDNAIADLGAPHASVFSMTASTLFQGSLEAGRRVLFHLPGEGELVTDVDQEVTLVVVQAMDSDLPPSPEDDFSGEESFYAHSETLDECGDPLFSADGARFHDGRLVATAEVLPVPAGSSLALLHDAQIESTFDGASGTAEVILCASLPLAVLGGITNPEIGEMTILEAFLLGGAAFGLRSVPGLTPDVDRDGDGLERVELDDAGRVARCVDGDATVIEGNDCWQDERIADGISFNLALHTVRAGFGGPWPFWRLETDDPCATYPPSGSVWSPCAASACARGASRSCTAPCGAEGVQECLWSCEGWGRCVPDRGGRAGVSSCAGVRLDGSATCGGDPAAARLVGETDDAGGLVLDELVTVGRGPLAVDATVVASRGSSVEPGSGWALVAYLGDEADIVGDPGANAGVARTREGYALQRGFGLPTHVRPTEDSLTLAVVDGSGDFEERHALAANVDESIVPSLDAWTEGAVTQRVRLLVVPDLPETAEDETVVVGYVLTDDGRRWVDVACYRDECAVPIAEGDVLQVGITAGTDANDSVVDVLLGGGAALSVEATGLCP